MTPAALLAVTVFVCRGAVVFIFRLTGTRKPMRQVGPLRAHMDPFVSRCSVLVAGRSRTGPSAHAATRRGKHTRSERETHTGICCGTAQSSPVSVHIQLSSDHEGRNRRVRKTLVHTSPRHLWHFCLILGPIQSNHLPSTCLRGELDGSTTLLSKNGSVQCFRERLYSHK